MPLVTIRTGFQAPDGTEEVLTQYICDWPRCQNVAVNVLGSIKELRTLAIVCEEHTPQKRRLPDSDDPAIGV